MKITLEHYNQKISVETDHDDVNVEEFFELVKAVFLAAGYSESSWEEWCGSY